MVRTAQDRSRLYLPGRPLSPVPALEERGRPVRLSNVALVEAGVSHNSKWRALQELEQADLIRVEGQRRKSPVVTVLAE